MTKYPNLKLYFFTPRYANRRALGDGLNCDDNPNGNNVFLYQFCDALVEQCKKNHVPCKNMLEDSGINR